MTPLTKRGASAHVLTLYTTHTHTHTVSTCRHSGRGGLVDGAAGLKQDFTELNNLLAVSDMGGMLTVNITRHQQKFLFNNTIQRGTFGEFR